MDYNIPKSEALKHWDKRTWTLEVSKLNKQNINVFHKIVRKFVAKMLNTWYCLKDILTLLGLDLGL